MTAAPPDPVSPTPGVIGVGTDLVDLDRFRRVLARRPSLEERVFRPEERAHAARRRDPAERLGARFAAKEAVMKALGVGLGAFPLRDVEVVAAPSGAPAVHLHGRAAALASQAGVRRWYLSLSHTAALASAVVVAEGLVSHGGFASQAELARRDQSCRPSAGAQAADAAEPDRRPVPGGQGPPDPHDGRSSTL